MLEILIWQDSIDFGPRSRRPSESEQRRASSSDVSSGFSSRPVQSSWCGSFFFFFGEESWAFHNSQTVTFASGVISSWHLDSILHCDRIILFVACYPLLLCIVFIFVNAAHIVMLHLCTGGEANKDHSLCSAPLKLLSFTVLSRLRAQPFYVWSGLFWSSSSEPINRPSESNGNIS